ncbi:hypothetical protein [Pararoseomonas baculiformis]|nr:hypothetical protein [Pararoseomonas baculiformis]
MREDAKQAAGQVQSKAEEVASQAKETLSSAKEEAGARAEELLHAGRERAEGLAEEGKAAAAERASGFASAIRNAADDLEDTSPEIARHVRTAAESVEGISAALRDRSAGELMQDVTDFARRQPAAFFGVAALAGFALVRFARSSAENPSMAEGGRSHAAPAPGWDNSNTMVPRPMTSGAASLGGSVAHRQGDAAPGTMPTMPGAAASAQRSPAASASFPSGSGSGSSPMPNERSDTPL